MPLDHTITAHPAGKSLTLADLRAFLDSAGRFGAALNAQVNFKVGFAGNAREMSITVPDTIGMTTTLRPWGRSLPEMVTGSPADREHRSNECAI